MKLARVTVTKYLKKGNELGWCEYDAKITNGKKVSVFKNKVYLDSFISIKKLCNDSEEKYGIKFKRSSVSLMCRGKQKQYEGFTFIYI